MDDKFDQIQEAVNELSKAILVITGHPGIVCWSTLSEKRIICGKVSNGLEKASTFNQMVLMMIHAISEAEDFKKE